MLLPALPVVELLVAVMAPPVLPPSGKNTKRRAARPLKTNTQEVMMKREGPWEPKGGRFIRGRWGPVIIVSKI